ncbi:MAG: IS110 family transposase [Gammaproteobacteria bacterium RIFCSPHIGHO2_12_FULL_35_23]|nr:MAG: IS110 family transposase [Gammaproteobacteria bacterium RIFCSPHIGHO2_12_FULL_35_23]
MATTIHSNTINQNLWVAIDIAKYKHEVLIEYPNGAQKRLIIMNTLNDFNRLADKLNDTKLPIQIGFEATGYYHRGLAYFLIKSGFNVKLISSIATARTRDAHYNSRDKNDKRDANIILYLLKSGVTQYYYDPVIAETNDIQELSNTYDRVTFRKTQLQHSILNHYLPLYFPEAEKYFCSTRAKWFAEFFYAFPCPNAITCYKEEEFIEKAWSLVGRKVDKHNWLKDVYFSAQNSVGLPIDTRSKTIDMYRLILNDFAEICRQRNDIENLADSYLAQREDYVRLKTVPGIGPIIAMTILAEAGNLRRFKHVNQFLKYCGFDLATKKSGTFSGKTTLSKRGNAKLRQMFWMASTIAIRMRENTFRRKYENYIKEDPKNANLKRKAYVAVAAKMARVVYSMIHHQTDYYCTHSSQ